MFVFTSGIEGLGPREIALFRQAALASRDGRWADAERAYRVWCALQPHDPRPAYGLSLLLLARGAYEEGWRLHEARCYLKETGVTKPHYLSDGRAPLQLPSEVANGPWGRQEIDLVDLQQPA